MRNLKRVLSLALALVMVLGMMVITTSAADFTDADEITYTEAVDVMSALGVFEGDNGALKPTQVLTRKEAAVIVARIILGKKMADSLVPTKQLFDDVATTEWYAAEVEYCNNIGMIVGHNGKFDPDGQLTGTAFAKLILCAMGYDAAAQGYVGPKWDTNINADAIRNKLNIAGVNINDPLTREGAAQMLFNALNGELVKYNVMFDYATGANVLVGPVETGDTFASEYFGGLTKVSGVIDEVNYYYGSTCFDGVEVRKSGADYNNIGYAAYVWALPGGVEGDFYLTAISDIIITGTSMGVNTNGADVDALTNSKHPAYIGFIDENGCSVFYNGKYQGEITLDDDYDIVYENKTKAAVEAALEKADKVGVKVEFIDNDNQGKAEAIAITEYTFSQVKTINKVSASGEVSIKNYELYNGTKIKPEKLVGATELAKGDYVTYVNYFGNYLTNVLDEAEGEFESITRAKLNTETVKVYTVAGEDYIKSELSAAENTEYLATKNINEDVVYVLDQYGYIVHAEAPAADPDSYVFVIDNEDSHGIKNLAETELAYVDGTVDIVDTAWKTDIEDGDLSDEIYTYTEKNGAYTLKDANAAKYVGDYETKTRKMGDLKVTLNTVVVDLRDYLAGDADEGTVYVGYREIPSFVDGTIYYLGGETIALAFLVDGEDPSAAANLSASFVVYNTETNKVDKVKGAWTYELEAGVLIEGEVEYNYILTQAQKDAIDALGVGVYTFAKDGSLASYISFTEDDVEWTPESSGALFKDDKEITDDYTAIFLNIADGEVNDWYEDVDAGEYYAYFDKKNDIVYVVADASIDEYEFDDKDEADVVTVFGGVAYYVSDGLLTNKTADTKEDVLAAGYDNVVVVVDGAALEVEEASYDVTYTVEADTDELEVEWNFEVEAAAAYDTEIEVAYFASAAIEVTYEVAGEEETVELEAGEGTFVIEVAPVAEAVEIVIVKIEEA